MKRIINKFSDTNMTIDPKFRNKLRVQVISAEQKQTPYRKKNNRMLRPQMVLVPALAVVALSLLTGVNFDDKRQLMTQKVSAAELIQKSIEATKGFDSEAYSYVESKETTLYGPVQPMQCGDEFSKGETIVTGIEYKYWTYRYQDERRLVEALYSGGVQPGSSPSSISVYDDTEKTVLPNGLFFIAPTLEAWTTNHIVNGKQTLLFVNRDGHEATNKKLAPKEIKGRQVYEFYTKRNPAALVGITHEDPSYVCSTTTLNHVVIDAETFLPVEIGSYRGKVSSDNRIVVTKFIYKYENLPADTALRRMTSAGFDKDTALHVYPGDNDGNGGEPDGQ